MNLRIHTVEVQMSGLCRGESCGFKPWTVLEGSILSFVLLRSVEISCFRGKKIKK